MFGKKKVLKKLTDEQRNWVINRAPLNDVISYSDQLTTDERNKAANRIESERRLHSLRYSGALKKYNDITTAVENTSKILKTGLEINKLRGSSDKKAPNYSYDSMSTYYDQVPRNGTGADWSGIYGGSVFDKMYKRAYDKQANKKFSKKLQYNSWDSKTTKKVKDDFNTLSDQEFFGKYKTSKSTYYKRAEKATRTNTDPYKKALARNKKLKNSWYYKTFVEKRRR